MCSPDQYRLLDFGDGRKLERFGRYILDRPAPACQGLRRGAEARWAEAAGRYERTEAGRGRWSPPGALPPRWTLRHRALRFELRPTPWGQVGLFPEQVENWAWLAERVSSGDATLEVLNLFAYTGGATLAAAASGARVAHIDAARSVVQWARKNAEQSGLGQAVVRWIVEDAGKFVRRELQRGHCYDALILDPPSYGHGPRGESWKLADDLLPLLAVCGQLVRQAPAFVLLTCHTPGWGPRELQAALVESRVVPTASRLDARELFLDCEDGRRLPSGAVARWPG